MALIKSRPTIFDVLLREDPFFSVLDRSRLANATNTDAPAVNTYRTGNDLTFEVAAPGYSKENLNVSVDRNILTIQGASTREERQGAMRTEFETTTFTRTFTLPADADPTTLTASYADGILTVNASLVDSSKTLTIDIK